MGSDDQERCKGADAVECRDAGHGRYLGRCVARARVGGFEPRGAKGQEDTL